MAPSRSRMSEPLTGTGAAPAVETIAAPASADPDDALGALLAGDPSPETINAHAADNPLLTPEQREALRELARVKATRADYQKREKALGRHAAALQKDLLAVRDDPDSGLDYGRPFQPFVEDGFEVRPFLVCPRWPKYRDADEIGTPFTVADLVEAVREHGDPEVTALINVSMAKEWSSWVGQRVKAWVASMPDPDAGRMVDGRYVDHDGEPLDADELGDPADESLALPRALRRIVTVVEAPDIRFTRVPLKSSAVAAVNAAQEAAEAAAGGDEQG